LSKVDQTVCGFLNPGFNTFISTSYTNPNDCATTVNVVQQGYFSNTATTIIGTLLIVNLNGIVFSTQTEFNQKIAKIDFSPSTYRLGRFRLSGISNPSGMAGLMWKTSGGGSETKVFSLANTAPWLSTQVDLIATNPPSAPLPLELVAFTVRPLNATDAQLDWITANEINSSHFDIQRSIQGISWITIDTVAAAGNSQSNRYYNLIDKNVFDPNAYTNTNFYYRLKMVDLDGHFEYSDVRQVKFESRAGPIVGDPFPNPTGLGNTSVQLPVSIKGETNLRIDIYDFQGKIVSTNTSPLSKGNNKLTIGTGTLSLGVYIIKLTMEDGESFVRKLTVQ
ncbi:MAG: T9SS type A sorting domain-containing protein, partial [Phycisphaerae bacterium]|nr:T9SS type A sorting domain-containing protein [Saprospiraceae bacterium]